MRATWVLVLAGLIGCGAGEPIERQAQPKKQQEDSLEDAIVAYMLAVNRYRAASDELEFWLLKLGNEKVVADLDAEVKRLEKAVGEAEKKVETIRKATKDDRPLIKINPKKVEDYDSLAEMTTKATKARLGANRKALGLECETLRAKLIADNPVEQPRPPKVDRNTPAGEKEYQDFLRLKPALEKAAKARRDLKVEELYVKESSAVEKKWVKKTHDENVKAIADFEKELFGGK